MSVILKIAFRYIKKGKTKTAITFAGVFLATFIMSVVAILGNSTISSIEKDVLLSKGKWHIGLINGTDEEKKEFINNKNVKDYCIKNDKGFAVVSENIIMDSKPYVNLFEVSSNWHDIFSVELVSGRYPEKMGEVIVPQELVEHYQDMYDIGKKGSIDVGKRYDSEGQILNGYCGYGENEEYKTEGTYDYEIVGVYKSDSGSYVDGPLFYNMYAYSTEEGNRDVIYAVLKNPSVAFDILSDISMDNSLCNNELLDILGVKENGESTRGSIGLVVALMIVIVIVFSIILIKNSFMISINERIKQFGLLSSLGVNNKQISMIVMFEALFIQLIAIPLAIALGYISVWISMHFFGEIYSELLYIDIRFNVYCSQIVIILIILLASITVFISVISPAKTAMKLKPIEVIRQSKNSQIFSKKHRSRQYKIIEKLVVKRNITSQKSKFISIVLSIAVSIILLLSVKIACYHTDNAVIMQMDMLPYDISISLYDIKYEEFLGWYNKYVKNNEKVDDSSWFINIDSKEIEADKLPIVKEYKDKYGKETVPVNYIMISTELFKDVKKSLNYDKADFSAVIFGQNVDYKLKNDDVIEIRNDILEEYKIVESNLNDEKINCLSVSSDMLNEKFEKFKGMDTIYVFLPEGTIEPDTEMGCDIFIEARDHKGVTKYLEENIGTIDGSISDDIESFELEQKSLTMIQMFIVIFTIFVSVISFFNIFLTIVANMAIRSKEFMGLISLGLGNKGIIKILFMEFFEYFKYILMIGYGGSFILSFVFAKLMDGSSYYYPYAYAIIYGIAVLVIFILAYVISYRNILKNSIVDELKRDW